MFDLWNVETLPALQVQMKQLRRIGREIIEAQIETYLQ
jgi:hypothetical protein